MQHDPFGSGHYVDLRSNFRFKILVLFYTFDASHNLIHWTFDDERSAMMNIILRPSLTIAKNELNTCADILVRFEMSFAASHYVT